MVIVTFVAKQMICEEMWSCSMTVEPHSLQVRHKFFSYFTANFCNKQPRVWASEVMGGGWSQSNEKVKMAIWEW